MSDDKEGTKSKFGFNNCGAEYKEAKPKECGWCGIRVATATVLATPTCPTCADSRKVRIEQWHARMRRGAKIAKVAIVIAVLALAACGDNQQLTAAQDAQASALFGEPCAQAAGADITPCHDEQGACVVDGGDTVCRPWCTLDCASLGGIETKLPAGASGWTACVCTED